MNGIQEKTGNHRTDHNRLVINQRMGREWETLSGAVQGDSVPANKAISLARLIETPALGKDRVQNNENMRGVLLRESARHHALRDIDEGVKKEGVTLADEGRADLARAKILQETAGELTSYVVSSTGSVNHGASGMQQSVLRSAMQHEVRGVAALEGREGLQKRTGLEDEAFSQFVEKSGVGSILSRFDAEHQKPSIEAEKASSKEVIEEKPSVEVYREESGEVKETPEQRWSRLSKELSSEELGKALEAKRLELIVQAFDGKYDRESKVARAASLSSHQDACERGVASGLSLKVNQGLMRHMPEGSEMRDEMAAVRTTCLEQRKIAREMKAEGR